jgi:hypothetical protein
MKIGLDFDKTYTADPILWGAFVRIAKKLGHEVVIVTFRMEERKGGNHDVTTAAFALGINAIFANGEPKASVYPADIWIDDFPALIPTPEHIALIPEIRDRVLKNNSKGYEGGGPK